MTGEVAAPLAPLNVTDVAPLTLQLKLVDWPAVMVEGEAAKLAMTGRVDAEVDVPPPPPLQPVMPKASIRT